MRTRPSLQFNTTQTAKDSLKMCQSIELKKAMILLHCITSYRFFWSIQHNCFNEAGTVQPGCVTPALLHLTHCGEKHSFLFHTVSGHTVIIPMIHCHRVTFIHQPFHWLYYFLTEYSFWFGWALVLDDD